MDLNELLDSVQDTIIRTLSHELRIRVQSASRMANVIYNYARIQADQSSLGTQYNDLEIIAWIVRVEVVEQFDRAVARSMAEVDPLEGAVPASREAIESRLQREAMARILHKTELFSCKTMHAERSECYNEPLDDDDFQCHDQKIVNINLCISSEYSIFTSLSDLESQVTNLIDNTICHFDDHGFRRFVRPISDFILYHVSTLEPEHLELNISVELHNVITHWFDFDEFLRQVWSGDCEI
ncbi:hypothetical protein QJS10_CPB19g01864 [Acorus calamus]|uniref:Uncharacterized protein n=1 Tax=Acorus calamus TaxID=4465 RepID=A0AAV9CH97_ACOCL|nr:hypothetical protein QJS10_CPB19g01864 [Acorus calamus]